MKALVYNGPRDVGVENVPDATMNDLVKSVRATGGMGVVGVFVPLDPGSADRLAQFGKISRGSCSVREGGPRGVPARSMQSA